MLNQPSFVTHNSASKTFQVTNTGNIADIGEHIVTIRHTISVPTDVN